MHRRTLAGIAVLLATVLAVSMLLILFDRQTKNQNSSSFASADISGSTSEEQEEGLVSYQGAWYAPKKKIETMLLIGLDKFEADQYLDGYINTQQSDFLLLLILDKANETCSMVQLNRDTMTEITVLGLKGEKAGTIDGQLALAHTYGSGGKDSCRNTAKAVSGLLYGVTIDHYMSITMDAVKLLNDFIGGVTVTIEDDFSNIDPALKQGETVTLHGDQALTFVRSRGGVADGTNLNRMKRQQQYFTEFQKVFVQKLKNEPDALTEVLFDISPYMVSDCTVNQLQKLYERMEAYETLPTRTIDGEAVKENGVMAFYPDESALRKLVIELFYDRREDESE